MKTGTLLPLYLALVTAGCSGGGAAQSGASTVRSTPTSAATPSVSAAVETPTVASPSGDGPTATVSPPASASSPSPASSATAIRPAIAAPWANLALTNVRDGSRFTIADFAGRPIFVETMAIWCTNCLEQQKEAKRALEKLPGDVAWVVLDVDTSESADSLKRYAEQRDFPFIYAVAPPELSRALARDFGDLVLAPPATPIIVIGRDGRITQTPDGHKSVEDLVRIAREHGG